MILDCPSCLSRYELPETLLGPAGARVRCPACGRSFAVDLAGHAVTDASGGGAEPGRAPRVAAVREPVEDAAEVARSLVESFAGSSGEEVRAAGERGRLFAEWGPRLLDLFEEYRRRAGPDAATEPFREALRRQLGIDLPDAAG